LAVLGEGHNVTMSSSFDFREQTVQPLWKGLEDTASHTRQCRMSSQWPYASFFTWNSDIRTLTDTSASQ
jgi:hypothetical protein